MISRPTRQQQKGVFSIIAGAALLVAIGVAALAIDLGHAYWVKRDLQKAADLASLSAVTDLSNATVVAERIANANGFVYPKTGNTMDVYIGVYDRTCLSDTPSPKTSKDCFTEAGAAGAGGALNSVQVTVRTPMKYYFWSFGGERTVEATAISVRDPIAAFSLGSFIARLDTDNSPLLNGVLGGLLGGHINLDIGSYRGLAAGSITLANLVAVPNLEVGTVDELLKANLTVAELISASITALNRNGDAASVEAAGVLGQILPTISTALPPINLGDLLSLETGSANAAANAGINVLQLVTVAAQLSNGKHFIDIPSLGVDLGPLANVRLGLSVIEPPTIAIGPARCVAGSSCDKNSINDWMTKAHAAQVRLKLDVTLLGGVVNLPIYLEAGAADAALTGASCNPEVDPPRQADILVQPQLLRALIGGGIDQAVMENHDAPVPPPTAVDIVNLLGLIKITSKADVALGGGGGSAARTVTISGPPFPSSNPETVVSLGLGANLNTSLQANMVTAVVSLLGIPLIDAGPILEAILGLLGPVLDGLLTPLLSMLGVQLGGADVTLLDVNCGVPQLVY